MRGWGASAAVLAVVTSGCSLSFDYKNPIEEGEPKSINGRVVREGTGGIMLSASPCRVAVRYTPVSTGTDELGKFKLRWLPAGEHELAIQCDPDLNGEYDLKLRRPGVRLGAGDAVDLRDVVVQRTGSVIGTVSDAGQAASAGVLVFLEGTDQSTRTDDSGGFRIDWVTPGEYNVFAAIENKIGEKLPVTVASQQETPADMSLEISQQTGSLVGLARIWDLEGGEAHADISVRIWNEDNEFIEKTGSDGSFFFYTVPAGAYAIEASLVGHQSAGYPQIAVRPKKSEADESSRAPDIYLLSDEIRDCDADSLPDEADEDDDNDGVPDAASEQHPRGDRFPCDPREWDDTDDDGIGDNTDTDDDDDGYKDWEDDCPKQEGTAPDGCPEDVTCQSDTDCPDQICEQVGESKTCVDGCNVTGCETGETCSVDSNRCEGGQALCQVDDDCTPGMICEDGQCMDGCLVTGCDGGVCNDETGRCEQSGCTTDGDCGTRICEHGLCVDGCDVTGCIGDPGTSCSEHVNRCVPESCGSDANCNGLICEEFTCVPGCDFLGCADGPCNPVTKRCDVSGCIIDEDCDVGQYCPQYTHECEPVTLCQDNTDCQSMPAGNVCIQGQCKYPCALTGCMEDLCHPQSMVCVHPCTGSEDCAGQGSLTVCEADPDGRVGDYCQEGCDVAGCSTGESCSPEINRCVPNNCSGDGECKGLICDDSDFYCTPGCDFTGCDHMPGTTCDGLTKRCEMGGCTQDTECSPGNVCEADACIPRCMSDIECGDTGRSCNSMDGHCAYPCTADRDCVPYEQICEWFMEVQFCTDGCLWSGCTDPQICNITTKICEDPP